MYAAGESVHVCIGSSVGVMVFKDVVARDYKGVVGT